MVSRWEIDSYRGGEILENSNISFFFGNLGSLRKGDLKFGWIIFVKRSINDEEGALEEICSDRVIILINKIQVSAIIDWNLEI